MSEIEKVQVPVAVPSDGRIGVIAPSGAVPRDRFEQGVAVMESMGFSVVVHGSIFDRHRYLAGTDRQRAAALHRCFEDDTVDAVICARGGYGALRLLPFLDPATIRRHPKPFIGFSDISALHWAFYRCCRLATFHGPVVTSLADGDGVSREALMTALCARSALQLKGTRLLRGGRAAGPVIGGNLSTLNHLLGTPFAPCFSGAILILEDTHEPTYKIDRMLSQMKLAGCFEDLSGLVLGDFTDCGPLEAIFEVVADVFEGGDFPIMAGAEVGHGAINRTVPMGVPALLDTSALRIIFDSEAGKGIEAGPG